MRNTFIINTIINTTKPPKNTQFFNFQTRTSYPTTQLWGDIVKNEISYIENDVHYSERGNELETSRVPFSTMETTRACVRDRDQP